jgi:hypothetical protein
MLPYCASPIGKILRQVSRRNVVKWQPDSFQEMNNSARNPGESRCRIFMKFPAFPPTHAGFGAEIAHGQPPGPNICMRKT